MAASLDPKDLVTLEELALSTMWKTSALVEGLGLPAPKANSYHH